MIVLLKSHSFILFIFVENIGIINEISISKIKKMVAIKKKWVEKFFRGDDIFENPHSNGEFFSRLIFFFFEIVIVIIIIINIISNVVIIVKKILIIFLNFNLLVGS